jgi:hypothetical protein
MSLLPRTTLHSDSEQKKVLLRGKCKGNAQIYAETPWEMRLKALGDHLSRT